LKGENRLRGYSGRFSLGIAHFAAPHPKICSEQNAYNCQSGAKLTDHVFRPTSIRCDGIKETLDKTGCDWHAAGLQSTDFQT
jgi:hypothetical protein